MPWVSRLNYIIIEEDKRLKKFGNEFVQSLKEMLGDEAPQHIIEEIIKRAEETETKSIITYYIPWNYTGNIDEETKEALDLIIKTFKNHKAKIRWIKAEYIPPGLVREVVELINTKGMDEAEKTVNEWVDAYITVLKIAGLDKGEWEESFVISARTFFNTIVARGALAHIASNIILNAVITTIITLLTFHTFKAPQSAKAGDVIKLAAKLAKLKAPKPSNEPCGEFNELGKLIAYKLATVLGLDVEEVCYALTEISGIDKDKLRSMIEDIYKRIAEVEEKVKILEKRLETFKKEYRADIIVVNRDEFRRSLLYPNIEVEEGELRIKVDIDSGHYRVIEEGDFKDTLGIITDKLKNGSTVVLTGPKGIGKSTLSALAIWRLLDSGEIGLVARVNELVNKDRIYSFDALIDNYLKEFRNIFGKLLILYDPSSTEMYGEEGEMSVPARVTDTIKNLLKIVNRIKDSLTLIILPSDIYNALSEEMKKSLEQYEFKVKLSDTKFLCEIIREYSGKCKDKLNENELNELASKVAEYEEGYTLIARLVGIELTKSDCNVDDIKRVIDESEYKANVFIASYINSFFDVNDDDRARALVEIFALRRPFVDKLSPGKPILTPGIVEIIRDSNDSRQMTPEMVNWLVYRQHDLIEETISKILDGEDLGEASNPWRKPKVIEKLREVSEKMKDVVNPVIYFVTNYGKNFTDALKNFSDKCWRRAALIIGYSLTGHTLLPQAEDLSEDVVKLLNDALKPCSVDSCGVDYYLLVGNEIPPLIEVLILGSGFELIRIVDAFVDKYNDAIGEIKNVLNNAGRKGISPAERFYGLGLASIVVYAVKLGKDVSSDDIDAVVSIASSAVLYVTSISLLPILRTLDPLCDKAPHRYLELLVNASSSRMFLGHDTAKLVFGRLNYVLDNHCDEVKKHAWPLLLAVTAYVNLLSIHELLIYFDEKDIEEMVRRVVDSLSELGDTVLGTIAWAGALSSALLRKYVRMLMEMKFKERGLRIDVIKKSDYVLNKLNELRENVEKLLRDKEFMGYAESRFFKADENAAKEIILSTSLSLKYALAFYKYDNDELNEAAGLFEKVANGRKEIGEFEGYLISRSLVLCVKAIEDSLASNDLVKEYDQLFNEALNNFNPTANYLDATLGILNNYLVSLALTNNTNKVGELLKEYWAILNIDKKYSVMTRLILNTLLGSKNGLDDRLKDMLVVDPEELIVVFEEEMHNVFLPALKVAYGLVKPEDGIGNVRSWLRIKLKYTAKILS
jgi:KaiC/GvpD/RAD55 family RecA-like ATPase